MTDDERLAAAVPANVREVCRALTAAGYQAVTVGGAVRDALLGNHPKDWDVATSALPEQVVGLFRHTIPTGLQHGTVTVVTGRGKDSHVEVTTFRGEGAYSDARRPDHVVFGVPLVEDLARRDLVVNAIAYDPAHGEIIDPFGGKGDIAGKRLRAVGDPIARFTEDGLRVMRAVRFAAQLEFELNPATEAGIPPALPSLAKVSRERISDELRKLLATREPSRGLAIAERTGTVKTILPELSPDRDWLARIDRATPRVRLAALLVPFAGDADPLRVDRAAVKRVGAIVRRLKFSNLEAELAAHLVGVARAPTATWTDVLVRRLLAEIPRDLREPAVELWDAQLATGIVESARRALADRVPLENSDLAVTGQDVMTALDMPQGRAIGRILAMLLDRVLDEPALNTRDALLAIAQQLELEAGTDGH